MFWLYILLPGRNALVSVGAAGSRRLRGSAVELDPGRRHHGLDGAAGPAAAVRGHGRHRGTTARGSLFSRRYNVGMLPLIKRATDYDVPCPAAHQERAPLRLRRAALPVPGDRGHPAHQERAPLRRARWHRAGEDHPHHPAHQERAQLRPRSWAAGNPTASYHPRARVSPRAFNPWVQGPSPWCPAAGQGFHRPSVVTGQGGLQLGSRLFRRAEALRRGR